MKVHARRNENMNETTPEEAKAMVKKFSDEIINELGTLIKSVVWFGSRVRRPFKDGKKALDDTALFGSDIDVLIVFDDLVHVLNAEVVTAYRVVVESVAAKVSRRLHITTMPVTKFWDYAYNGDPILINMLRDGEEVFDTGCFGMAKQMLSAGQVKPSKEIVWTYLAKGPMSVSNSYWNMKQAVLNLYFTVIDAAHAALLSRGVAPDTPEHLVPLVKEHLVDTMMLERRYLSILSEFHNIGMMVMKGEVNKIRGDSYDRYRKEAETFLQGISDMLGTRRR
jgi:uncharacterized protein (UPF0332 family)/predicted nucleotidyltransferase